MSTGRLIVVSNRLPLTLERRDATLSVRPSDGGLVSAMLPVVRASGGAWIGWSGGEDSQEARDLLASCAPFYDALHPVFLSAGEKSRFYDGCCNQLIWPLFHDLPSHCNFDPAFWEAYRAVNEKFADAVGQVWRNGDFIWVHDYHLMLLADCLQARGLPCRVAYFHHIPFPHPEMLEKLPWREELLAALLQFRLAGFQTVRDRRNFVACIRRWLPGSRVNNAGGTLLVRSSQDCAEVGTFPIGIDFAAFEHVAARPETGAAAAKIRAEAGNRRIILGVDRLDYTKGILERLRAFENLLCFHPELRGQVTLVQVVVPSREEIAEYRNVKAAIGTLAGRINTDYGTAGWTPVQYLYRSLTRKELVAYYRAADVALLTPLKDGMNLVAKEFCAARVDEKGALVLSEFAGAAAQLKCGALLVNPHDCDGVADALQVALRMPEDEQRSRMSAMRAAVRAQDVFSWARSFSRHALPLKSRPRDVAPLAGYAPLPARAASFVG